MNPSLANAQLFHACSWQHKQWEYGMWRQRICYQFCNLLALYCLLASCTFQFISFTAVGRANCLSFPNWYMQDNIGANNCFVYWQHFCRIFGHRSKKGRVQAWSWWKSLSMCTMALEPKSKILFSCRENVIVNMQSKIRILHSHWRRLDWPCCSPCQL